MHQNVVKHAERPIHSASLHNTIHPGAGQDTKYLDTHHSNSEKILYKV